jgi:hypothetical protein
MDVPPEQEVLAIDIELLLSREADSPGGPFRESILSHAVQ